ncbi:MAG: uroporphyrinogen-III synthase [Segetibacter sp.]
MKDENIHILSTRPLDVAVIEKAAYQNIIIDTISFIEVKKMVSDEVAPRINELSKGQATVVFTSTNAVEIVVESLPVTPQMPDWKIYCIGGATFTLVKKYWPYDQVVLTTKNATELAKGIVDNKVERVAFFCGNMRREELPDLLIQQNIPVEELIVYETIETPVTVEQAYNGILFFSPSAVHSFFLNNHTADETIFFAIGDTTANTIKQFATNNIIVSDFPAKDQLVDKAIKYFSERTIANNEKA